MTTVLKYTEKVCKKESKNFFFVCVVAKAEADGLALLDRRVMLGKRSSFIMIKIMKQRHTFIGIRLMCSLSIVIKNKINYQELNKLVLS